jgi:mono/diheme cytochrome c family protein
MPPLRRRTACAGFFLCACLVFVAARAEDDVARGERLYQARCGACHSLDEHGAGPIGPAGTAPLRGFAIRLQ